MEGLVIDCSITMSWCFADEDDAYAKGILAAMPSLHAVVPSHWPLEVAHTLLKGERRGRITEGESTRFLTLLGSLSITIDAETASRSFRESLILARTHQLSSYDGAYLECAQRLGLPLATLDERLKVAATAANVALYEVPETE
jgi:predicted nucleic acid-binding protein